jgi:hypothetical protein
VDRDGRDVRPPAPLFDCDRQFATNRLVRSSIKGRSSRLRRAQFPAAAADAATRGRQLDAARNIDNATPGEGLRRLDRVRENVPTSVEPGSLWPNDASAGMF